MKIIAEKKLMNSQNVEMTTFYDSIEIYFLK